MVIGCDQAVRRIAERYGESLGAFKFPVGIASELNEICRGLGNDTGGE